MADKNFKVKNGVDVAGAVTAASFVGDASQLTNVPVPTVDFDDKTSSYTLVLTDKGKTINMNVASANTVTVPADSSVNFDTGSVVDVVQTGAGQTEIVAGTFTTPSDASTWVTQTSNFGGSAITSIAYGEDTWVAVGGGGQIRTSTDTTTWTTRTSNFGTTFIRSVANGNDTWVATGDSGQIRTSTDAITWTTRTSNFPSVSIFSVAYGNGVWAAVGESGNLRTSTDAVTWTTRTSNFGFTYIQAIAYGNGTWVAGGEYGQLRTSTDAVTWTTRTSNFGDTHISSLSYGNGIWVAVGQFGTARRSTDAVTWTTVTSNFGDTNIATIAYGNGLWVAGGTFGTMRKSTDGTTWTTVTSNFGTSLITAMAYGNGSWVAGGGGEFRTSLASTTSITINSKNGFKKISERYGTAKLVKKDTNEWLLTGDLTGAADGDAVNINQQTGTSYTLALADATKVVEMNNANANTITVPLNSSQAFATGAQISIVQTGAGQTTIAGDTGVTVNSASGLKLRAQWSAATLVKRDTNTWVVFGDLEE